MASNTGVVTVRQLNWQHIDSSQAGCLDAVTHTLFGRLKRAEWIETMAYSPDEKLLAIGSHDNNIYLVDTDSYKKVKALSGHSSFLKSLDWSADSKWLRSTCGAYELLFFNAKTKKRDARGATNTIPVVWDDQTVEFGWSVQGIYPSGCDGSHINAVCATEDQKLIATADDYGLVSIFRNPVLNKHKAKRYRGHSEHVTNVKFSASSHLLFSTGGQD